MERHSDLYDPTSAQACLLLVARVPYRSKHRQSVLSLSSLWCSHALVLVPDALLNLGCKPEYADSITKLGFSLEDLLDSERDAGLGNGGLGRLAACYLDSLSSTNIPGWGYGLRYQYGIFKCVPVRALPEIG